MGFRWVRVFRLNIANISANSLPELSMKIIKFLRRGKLGHAPLILNKSDCSTMFRPPKSDTRYLLDVPSARTAAQVVNRCQCSDIVYADISPRHV